MTITNTFGKRTFSIEAQEREGQAEITSQRSQLPAQILHCTQADFEALGVVFLNPTEGDPLFWDVTLPDGMELVPTSHSMWSDLVDAGGTAVAQVFYKAAFYDRGAHMWVTADLRSDDAPMRPGPIVPSVETGGQA